MATDWLPSRLADQADMFQNVGKKIAGYATDLGLSAGQVTTIERLCAEFEAAYSARNRRLCRSSHRDA